MAQHPSCILIGASTGGIEALHRLLGALPANLPPILVVQHIRPGFLQSVVEGLQKVCRMVPCIAADGMPARHGQAYFAPDGDRHLEIDAALSCRLVAGPPEQGHRPSVDVLFRSALRLATPPIGILLTGMGRDGANGLRALRDRGAMTITQDRASSVVWGMPRAAVELDAAALTLPLDRIGPALVELTARGRAA